jgi:hypothetical protein
MKFKILTFIIIFSFCTNCTNSTNQPSQSNSIKETANSETDFNNNETQNDVLKIKLPITSQFEQRDAFQMGVLKLVLDKTEVPYTLEISKTKMEQTRIIESIANKTFDLYWMGTSKSLEEKLLPIRYPIFRGLIGYRLFIINKADQTKFKSITDLTALQRLTGSQGYGWSDIEILENSGLKQIPAEYENIFKLIHNGNRVDYFSRAISEAFEEVETRSNLYSNLAVDEQVLLVYPFALLFFTNRENSELAELLTEGFEKAYEDGSFNEFFYNHEIIKKMFENANLESRIRIDIPNPLLTEETAAIPKKYWHDLK